MFSDFPTWWDGLSTIAKIYWIIAFPATMFFLIQLIMTFIGGGADHNTDIHGDHHAGSDDGGGFHLFTIKNLIAFFTLFAWSGLACIEGRLNLAVILIISTICGLVMMFVMAGLFYYISRLAYSGTMEFKNAIGVTGDVYLSIPAKKSGAGKVQVKVQGAVRTLDAMTEDPEIIKTGSLIQVTEIGTNNLLIVKRVR
jgi:membrane protein implicated in regulation of membrane protease activity